MKKYIILLFLMSSSLLPFTVFGEQIKPVSSKQLIFSKSAVKNIKNGERYIVKLEEVFLILKKNPDKLQSFHKKVLKMRESLDSKKQDSEKFKEFKILLDYIFYNTSKIISDIEQEQDYLLVFELYGKALNKGDLTMIEEVTTKDFRNQMEQEGLDFEELGNLYKKASITHTECVITTIESSEEEVIIGCKPKFEYVDGSIIQENDEDFFILIKENDKWLIDSARAE